MSTPTTARDRIVVRSYLGAADERALADDVLDGLTRPFKELKPKHLYDQAGAELFDRICDQPEYYPTRTERSILEARSADIAALTGATELVELGAGTAAKTRILLRALDDAGTLRRYVPLDVTEGMVRDVAAELVGLHPGLRVHGIVGDFERHLVHLPEAVGPRIIAFLGGTIGNFTPGARRSFLRDVGRRMGPDDVLLLGTDLVKDPGVMEAAYDDAAGVSAAFARNGLSVINRELGANFEPERFEYVAFYDRERAWVDMRLRATERMEVRVEALDLAVSFAAREELRTEISTKFTRERLEQDLGAAGLELVELMTDPEEQFALTLARPRR